MAQTLYERILARDAGGGSGHPTRTTQPGFRDPSTGYINPGPLGGFLASSLSSIPEFVGAEPTPLAAAFRTEHPWAGLASEMLPLAVPYVGAYRLSQIPALATRLEGVAARVANPITSPILHGAAREMIRYAPLEASRLAVGAVAYPDNFGELFADVAFSEAMAGGFGAVGGFFRAGGRAGREARPDVSGVDMYAAPTVQLRSLREGGELVDPAFGREAAEQTLINDVLTEAPGTGGISRNRMPTIHNLDGARGRQDVDEVNSFFSLSDAASTGVRRQLLAEGDEASLTTLNVGQQQEIAEALGLQNIAQVAESTFFPRIATAVDQRGAGVLGRLFENPTLQRVDENTWLAREAGDGLHVVARRLPSVAPNPTAADLAASVAESVAPARRRRPRAFGPAEVRAGDRFLIAKTDRPGIFSPAMQSVADSNYATWARWRQAWQEPFHPSDIFSQADNELLATLTPQDYTNLRSQSRRTWVDRKSEALTKRATGEAGLTDSATGRAMAEQLHDLIAPTMFKQGRSGLYARFESVLRNRISVADQRVRELFRGRTVIAGSALKHIHKAKLEPVSPHGTMMQHWNNLTDDELELAVKAGITQTPADDLAKLTDDGVVSASASSAIRSLQALDQEAMQMVLPALEASGSHTKFNMLEGYIMPVARLGDFMQSVRDEAGRVVSIVSGKTGVHTNRQADAIVAEAQRQGRTWTTGKSELSHVTEHEPSQLDTLFADVQRRIGTDESADAIVRDAMKRLQYSAHGGRRQPSIGTSGTPGMFKTRTGLTTIVEMPNRKELLESIEAHYTRLFRYAATQGYAERWGNEITRFQKYEPTLAADLMRKRDQYLGIEGQITNTLNKVLQPVLGHVLGSKPATRIAAATNELMYNFNLAWVNPTFALLNSLTPIMTVLPHIAFTLQASRSTAQRLMQFIPMYGEAGLPIGAASHLSPLKVLWQAVRDMKGGDPELRKMWQELADDGTLHQSQLDEFLGPNGRGPQSLRETFKQDGYVSFFRESSTYMARKSEEFSRLVSANAGYRLGRDAIGLEGAQLKNFTRRFVETTNYLYGVTDRPRLFTGPLGSIFGLFKNWQMHYLGMMANYAGLAWRENVWSPLLWQSGAALSLGGLGATPLRHIADGIANWYTGDDSSYRWMLENWPNAADEIWFGLPSFLGVSLQASSAMPGTDVRNEITSLTSIVAWERAKAIGTAVGSAMSQSQATGENALENPNVRDQLLAALTPRVVSRMFASVEGDYIKSMTTGYPQVRNVSPAGRLLHGLGMNQIEIERQQIASRELWRDQERQRAMITGIGSAYAQAALRGDGQEMESLIQRSLLLGLPLSSVMRSAQNFQRREESSDNLSRFDRVEAGRWQAALEADGR